VFNVNITSEKLSQKYVAYTIPQSRILVIAGARIVILLYCGIGKHL